MNDIFSNQRLTGILGSIAFENEENNKENVLAISEDGTYRMGTLTGTVTGEYEAGFLGTKAREKLRLAKIKDCKERISLLEEQLDQLETLQKKLNDRKQTLRREYEKLPKEDDLREALQMLLAGERESEQVKKEAERIEKQIQELLELLKEKKKKALEIAETLYLTCSYQVFKEAKKASEE